MELDDIFSTRGSETERTSPGAILTQLKSKLKSQSTQLRLLESYKCLCEQRILDLYPNHPLPIQQDHIGQNIYSEALPLKQKISKLDQKLSQYCDPYLLPSPHLNSATQKSLIQQFATLQREKKELEESLRSETQLNEEQRSYIEVLKQALQINIEKLGLEGLTIEDFIGYIQLRAVIDEKNKELVKANNKSKELDYQVTALKEVIVVKNNENKELAEIWSEGNRKLQKKLKKIKVLKEDCEQLEEEKSRLIEYIDNTLANDNKVAEHAKELSRKLEKSENELQKSKETLKTLEVENRKMSEKLKVTNEEYEKCEKSMKEAQKFFLTMKTRVDDKEKLIKNLETELDSLKITNSDLTEKLEKVSIGKNALEKQLEQVKSELKVRIAENEAVKQENRGLNEELQMSKEAADKEITKNLKLVQEIDEKNKENCELSKKSELLQIENLKKHENLMEEVKNSQNLCKSMGEDNKKLRDQNENLKKLLEQSKNNESVLNEHNKVLGIKLETLTEHPSHSPGPSLADFSLLENELSHLNEKIGSSQSLKSENQELSHRLKVLNQSYEFLQKDLNSLQNTQKEVLDSLKSLNTLLQIPYSDTCTSLSLISIIKQQIQTLLNEKSNIEQELKSISNANKQQSSALNKCEQELSGLKSENLLQKSKIHKQNLEISYLNDSIRSQVGTLQGEIFVLRENVKELSEQNEKIMDSNRKTQLELSQCKFKLCSNEVIIQSHEDKSALLQNEKNQLANLIKKIQSKLNSAQLQQILSETFRIHSELEYCSLEKLRISMQLRKTDSSDPDYTTLTSQLSHCTQVISKHISKLNTLESDLENS